MSVPAAYLAVIAIWSTTPLAIKWSADGPGFVAGVTGRMIIGTAVCLLIVKLLRISVPWHREAVRAYAAGSLAVFGGMMCVYWAAQFVSSGLIALLFGLTPLVTTLIAVMLGTERRPGPIRLLGIITALSGLACIVLIGKVTVINENAWLGIGGVLLGMVMHSISTVWVKQAGRELRAMAMTTGSLVFSLPLYLLTWLVFDGSFEHSLPDRALTSIIYLGVFGSVLGYLFYFYALRHVSASAMALVTLITPVTALLLGQALNGERVSLVTWAGTALILLGLAMHQWGHRLRPVPA